MILTLAGIQIIIENFTRANYNAVRRIIADQISNNDIKKRDVIKNAFAEAVRIAPNSNHSDIWHHIIYRAYVEYYIQNRLGNAAPQSWVRASGEALEIFFCDYYNQLIIDEKIRLVPLSMNRVAQKTALEAMGIWGRIGNSKLDIAVLRNIDLAQPVSILNGEIFGGLHIKASLAERVSDDVPASEAMMNRGFKSFLLTLDVKSFPLSNTYQSEASAYLNRGELGSPERPSDKREYIEEHGSFDACISYNLRTIPSLETTTSNKKIFVSSFNGQRDVLCEMLLDEE